jgi:hypothetical protein
MAEQTLACRPATSAELYQAYTASLARSAVRLVSRHIKRTADVVDADYNLSSWRKVLDDERWLRANDLRDFLLSAPDTPGLRKVDGRIVNIGLRSYYSYRLCALGDLIRRHCADAREIVELGTGYGANLFALSLARPDLTFKGFDISANGIAAGNAIARHFGLSDRVSFDHIDLTDAADASFRLIEGATVFTHFCIEQIPYDVGKVVENILAAKPRRVINIEPTTELLDLTQVRDIVSFAYIRTVDYQTKLFTILDDLERKGRIRIIARERMQFAPTINHDGFLYCWEPV